ncbi:MAG: histidine kinase N-terminal 7TM domain-containing protein, partial [Parcubacteria group bacterium]
MILALQFHFVFTLVIILLNYILGLVVLLKNPRGRNHQSLALLIFTLATWAGLVVLENLILEVRTITLLNSFELAVGPLIVYALVIFALNFGEIRATTKLQNFLILLPALFFSSVALFTNLTMDHVEIHGEHVYLIHGPIFPAFFIYLLGYSLGGIVLLVLGYKRAHGIRKMQLFYMILGISITAVCLLTGGFISQFLTEHKEDILGIITRYSILSVTVSTIFATYAIVRYRFMDLRVVIRRGLIYSCLSACLLGLYACFVFFLREKLAVVFGLSSLSLTLMALAVVAVIFWPLKKVLGRLVGTFIKEKYDFQKTLRELTPLLTEIIKFDELMEEVAAKLKQSLNVEGVYCLLLDKKTGDPAYYVIGMQRPSTRSFWKIHYLNHGIAPVEAEDPQVAQLIHRCV